MKNHPKVRLSSELVNLILDYVCQIDEKAEVFIFGSRADLSKKGGDIDIFILSEKFSFQNRRELKFKMEDMIGEQKIDIVYAKDTNDSFTKSILEKAVKL